MFDNFQEFLINLKTNQSIVNSLITLDTSKVIYLVRNNYCIDRLNILIIHLSFRGNWETKMNCIKLCMDKSLKSLISKREFSNKLFSNKFCLEINFI